jgi:cytochrome P450
MLAPGPTGREMLGAIRRMRRDTLGWLTEVADRYGDVVAFPVPGEPVLLLRHPDAVQHVLQTNNRNYGKRTIQYDTLSIITGRGLLTNDGDSWLRRRRLTQPAFHHQRLIAVGEEVAAAADRLDAQWQQVPNGAVVDVDAAMMRTALEVVGHSLFTTDFAADADRLIAAVLTGLDLVVARASTPHLPMSVPTPGNLRMRRAVRTLDEAVSPLIAARRRRSDGPGDDLLGAYLSAGGAEADGDRLTDAEIRDEVVTLIVAGHETVASSLTWTWHLLGQHPEIADAVAAEAAGVLGGRSATAADVSGLDLTRRVIDESMRLYPPAWVISRRALGDDVIAGTAIPAGTMLILSPFLTQHDARFWPDPEAFDPQRWCPEQTAGRHRLAYFPFGAGPTLCIGRDFALLESVLLLATLAQHYRIAPVPGRTVTAEPLVTVRPQGGPLMLRRPARRGRE